ncbi:MAG TPA: response regulator transcription factor [Pseudolabrys sp.]|nr:response regulator transcription factor [Pseudolabrys sp.]
MRLLVVEDNEKLAALIKKLLSENGFAVDSVETADDAIAALATAEYSLIVLDLSLPDRDGALILKSLREKGHSTPVLVATARADVTQRVLLLNLGADDYLVKPFSLEELLARVRALLRRPKQIAGSLLVLGSLALDTAAMTLTIDGNPVELARREFAVLATLLGANGKLVSKHKLEQAIYSFDNEVTPNAIEAAVSRLRKRLDGCHANIDIVAMRGLGYILRERERASA